jgi:cobalt-zinc-cadmium efflux system membrane fusion protein
MKYLRSFPLCAAVGAITGLLLLSGCSGSSNANGNAKAPVPASSDPSVFQIEHPEQFPTVHAEERDLANQLQVDGVIAPDVNLCVHVGSLSGGKVIDVRVKLGDDVAKGQVLVVLRSQELASAISDYQKFRADALLAQKALERARLLYQHGAIAQKELQEAEDTEQKSQVDVGSGAEKIRFLGGDPANSSPVLEVKSPIPGTIVEQNTAGGEGVKSFDNSPSLFTVSNLSHVWVLCDVYENDLAQVHLGDNAEIVLTAYPNYPMRGKVGNISKVLDPSTRAAKVRIEMDNRLGLMKPGMFAVARFISKSSQKRVVIPTSAVLRLHDKDWVFLLQNEHRFRALEVRMGAALPDGHSIVLSGLSAGESIVINALQFSSAVGQQ